MAGGNETARIFLHHVLLALCKLATKTIFPIAGLLIAVGVCSSRRSRHVKFGLTASVPA